MITATCASVRLMAVNTVPVVFLASCKYSYQLKGKLSLPCTTFHKSRQVAILLKYSKNNDIIGRDFSVFE